jgi:hypothetical protein
MLQWIMKKRLPHPCTVFLDAWPLRRILWLDALA